MTQMPGKTHLAQFSFSVNIQTLSPGHIYYVFRQIA